MPGTSTEPVVDKGIRQKSIHSFHSIHSFPDGSAFCPGAPKRVPSDSEKHRRVYTSSNVCHSHEWRVDTASGLTLKKQNACLHAVRHAVGKKIACIHGLRSEGVRAYANDAGLDNTNSIWSTKLRKHVATASQILVLHDLQVHREYYQLPDTVQRVTKLSRLFLSLERGNLAFQHG